MLTEADTDKDGELSYQELVAWMLKKKEEEAKQEAREEENVYARPVAHDLIGPGENTGLTSVVQRGHHG